MNLVCQTPKVTIVDAYIKVSVMSLLSQAPKGTKCHMRPKVECSATTLPIRGV